MEGLRIERAKRSDGEAVEEPVMVAVMLMRWSSSPSLAGGPSICGMLSQIQVRDCKG